MKCKQAEILSDLFDKLSLPKERLIIISSDASVLDKQQTLFVEN